ncbi:MAG: metal ABC transporter substrate-binding protein [Trichococcus flocculiformis]|jgi:zinc transport system substrate-binding protein|uniref:Adhesion lipoprotein n=1 Tax=Trichococcus flocculiformis TaxID=82803 RepID=A0AB38BJ38_9LACT|nr:MULTISPECIES: metal ABC transporter substrate-binding protein [Trichococcus]CZQ80648.1 adhesion lipoprotein [Trichococcus sp. ES5]CZQ99033.1 adhesion lipoprotein [Trichococcus flocculiformis]SFH92633.1 zinc transport system substrate-binding protein [Trichococcus flocculiformis]SHF35699.1 zinc transport system substrate-binding protein [Trichococcus flocculiformis]HRG31385.1 metal ABC transporter substrate-binding protein [Trichococcus flocculiformis]
MKQKKSMKWALSLVGATALLAGCGAAGSTTENTESDKLQVVTTFYPMYDFTKQVAQDDAEVSMLLEAGMEVHSFEPSSQMIAEIQDADVFIYNSPEMETWVPDVLASIDTSDMVVICASDAITLLEYEGEAHAHDHESEEEGANAGHSHTVDPHVWLDPVLAQTEVSTIAEGLAEADPDNAEDYLENAGIYNGKLNELDEAYRAAFEGTENRTFVTQHAAFAYLAARYDLNQISVTGLNAEVEPSAAALATLSDYVKANNISHIYFENNASSQTAETLAEEVGVELAVLSPLEGITEEDQKKGSDYISVMLDNLEALKKSIN